MQLTAMATRACAATALEQCLAQTGCGHTLAVIITLCLTLPRAPGPGSPWSSLLAGWIHDSKAQEEHSSGPEFGTPGWYHHVNVPGEGEAWKVMLPDWQKEMQDTDTQDPGLCVSDRQSGQDVLAWHSACQPCPLSSG